MESVCFLYLNAIFEFLIKSKKASLTLKCHQYRLQTNLPHSKHKNNLQLLRFILSLRMNSSFIISRPALSLFASKMIAKLEKTLRATLQTKT